MPVPTNKKYLTISAILHAAIFLVFILGFDFAAPLVVVENTNKNDVISAVILGDTKNSKILSQQSYTPPHQEVKAVPKTKPAEPPSVKKDVIALKVKDKKKPTDLFGKDLLADLEKIKKETSKRDKLKQKQLKAQSQKKN